MSCTLGGGNGTTRGLSSGLGALADLGVIGLSAGVCFVCSSSNVGSGVLTFLSRLGLLGSGVLTFLSLLGSLFLTTGLGADSLISSTSSLCFGLGGFLCTSGVI